MINKTPTENEYTNVYEIEKVDKNLITKLIKSRFIGDGVYTIEQLSLVDYKELYLTSPSFDKYNFKQSNKEWTFNEGCDAYELILEKPMFMPLDVEQFVGLFESLSEIEYPIFTQVLFCNRTDNWREDAIHLYDQFLKGNEHPIDNKMIVKMQENFLKVLSKVGNFNMKREPIEEIDNKILQNNYRFECRIIILDNEDSNKYIKQIYEKLSDLNLFNRLVLKQSEKPNFLLESINNRKFQSEYVNQLLSEQELYSLLCKEGVDKSEAISKPSGKLKSLSLPSTMQKTHSSLSGVKYLPLKEKVNEEVDNETLEQLKFAFKRVNITKDKLEILDVFQGTTLTKVKIKIPNNVNYSSIQKNLKNIQAAIGNENISIEIGDQPDTVNFYLPRKNRDALYLRNILESDSFQEHCKNANLPFVIGENVSGEVLFGCLSDLKHLMVAGATGSGKSVFLNVILICLLLSVEPELLNIVLIDPKKVEFSNYRGFPQVSKIVTEPVEAVMMLDSLCVEMERRYSLFAKSGYRNIDQYNRNNEKEIPYIVCVIDEYADLVMVNGNVENHVVRLSQKARAAGIHLILATQKPLSDIVTSVLKSNLPSVISFRLKTSSDYQTVFGKGIPYNLLGKGDGVARLEEQSKEYERFQSPVITLDENEEIEILEQLKELFKDVPQQELEVVVEDEPIDKLKKIIASTSELRISELQSQMGIGINKVTELMRQLVDEEWLRKEGRSYEINVDEEEVVKWKGSI
jgi:DNA segregation ATPase FtsK/SpoIIIE, S-DNA-T family